MARTLARSATSGSCCDIQCCVFCRNADTDELVSELLPLPNSGGVQPAGALGGIHESCETELRYLMMYQAGESGGPDTVDEIGTHVSCGRWRRSEGKGGERGGEGGREGGVVERGGGFGGEQDRWYQLCGML